MVDCFLLLILAFLIPVILLSTAAAACEITSAGDAGWRWVEQRNPVSCSQECYTALQDRELQRSTLHCSARHINVAHCTALHSAAPYINIVHTVAPCINQRSASVQECCTGGGVAAQPAIQVEEGAAAAHSGSACQTPKYLCCSAAWYFSLLCHTAVSMHGVILHARHHNVPPLHACFTVVSPAVSHSSFPWGGSACQTPRYFTLCHMVAFHSNSACQTPQYARFIPVSPMPAGFFSRLERPTVLHTTLCMPATTLPFCMPVSCQFQPCRVRSSSTPVVLGAQQFPKPDSTI